MIRILFADDHALYREGVRLLLERAGLEVVGEAADGGEAVRLTLELLPDIVLLDLSMPVLTGIEATRKIRKYLPDAKVILLSMHEDESCTLEALRAGVSGYVFKTQTDKDLIHTIEVVAEGALYLGPRIRSGVMNALTQKESRERLTARERKIVDLIANGLTSREIAEVLGLHQRTVETQRGRIMRKLNLEQNAQLVSYAVRTQLQKDIVPG